MFSFDATNFRSNFSKDFFASIVVFLVALPLCMGIAIACNLPPSVGIVTGIVGGVVVGSIAGSPLQVSGPAAGLVVIVCELIREHGFEKLTFIILIAGLIQILAGSLKLAQWFRAVPPSVVNGMLSGIGVLIFASQFHVMVDDSSKGNGIQNLISIPLAIWKGLVPDNDPSSTHHLAAPIGLATILIIVSWEKFSWGKMKSVPSSLLAVAVATILTALLELPIKHVNIPGDLFQDLHLMKNFHPDWLMNRELYLDALGIALVATAETLLTATAIDKMHHGTRTNYDRELTAQGVGNMICGLLGTIPMTGVLVRSGVNVSAGAKSRLSTIMHGFWLLLFVSALPFVVRLIPTCSLAALLVYTGYRMANLKQWRQIAGFGRSELVIYIVTIVSIVCIDLLSGVLIGVAMSVAKLLYIFSHLEIEVDDDPESNRTEIRLKGAGSFLSLPKIASALEGVRPTTELHIRLDDLDYVDHACLDLFMNWEKQHNASGGRLLVDWKALSSVYKDSSMNRTDVRTKEFQKIIPASGKPSGLDHGH